MVSAQKKGSTFWPTTVDRECDTIPNPLPKALPHKCLFTFHVLSVYIIVFLPSQLHRQPQKCIGKKTATYRGESLPCTMYKLP